MRVLREPRAGSKLVLRNGASPMLKKTMLAAALTAGLVTVSVASVLLDVYGHRIESSSSIDVADMMLKSGNLPDQMPANPF
jgi:hypothetical protein